MASETAGWIGFGILMLCAFTSSYIVRLIFSILKGLQSLGVPAFILHETRIRLLFPVTLLFALLFTFLGVFVVFPLWDENQGLKTLESVLFAVYMFILWIVLMFFVYRVFGLCRSVLQFFLKLYHVKKSTRAIIFETFAVVTFFSFAFIFLATCGAFIGEDGNAISDSIFALVTSLNFFTATLMLALAPLLRDAIAGFTIYSDTLYVEGDLIEMTGVCPVGRIEGFGLRNTLVRLLDRTLLHLPNRYVLRRPLVNYSKRARFILQIKVPLSKDISSRMLRLLIKEIHHTIAHGSHLSNAEHRLSMNKRLSFHDSLDGDHSMIEDALIDVNMKRDDNLAIEKPFHTSVCVDDTVTLVIEAKLREKGFVGDHKQRTSLMLIVIEVLQKYKIQPRAPASFGYVDTMDTSTIGYISTYESNRNRVD